MALYIYYEKEQNFKAAPSMQFFAAFQFWTILAYSAILLLYHRFLKDKEDQIMHQIVAQPPPRDTYGARTERLLVGLLEEDEPTLFIDETWLAEKVYSFG